MGMSFADLVSEGNLGLIRAAGMYDQSKGFKFISYAVWWIRQSIIMSVVNNLRTVRLPASATNRMAEIKKVYEQLEQQLERPPSDAELKECYPKYDPSDKVFTQLFSRTTISLDAPHPATEEGTLLDVLEDTGSAQADVALLEEQFGQQLHVSLAELSTEERMVVMELYGLNELGLERTAQEVAGLVGIGDDKVKYVKKRSLAKMRAAIEMGRVEV